MPLPTSRNAKAHSQSPTGPSGPVGIGRARMSNRPPGLASLLAGVIGIAPLLLLFWSGENTPYLVPAALLWALVLITLAVLMIGGPIDRTNPLVWGLVAMLIMYSVHPVAVVLTGDLQYFYMLRYDRSSTYAEVTWYGLAASVALCIGYVMAGRERSARPTKAVPAHSVNPSTLAPLARRLGIASLVFAVGGYTLFSITTGQNPLESILGGARRGETTSSSAYLYLSPQLIGPAGSLLCYANHHQNRSQRSVILILMLQVLLFVPTGQRFVLLTSLFPTLMLWMYLRGARLRGVAFAGLSVLALLGLMVLRDAGSDAGTTLAGSFRNVINSPAESLTAFVTGPDTEMIDGLAIERQLVPEDLDHQPLSTITNTLAAPVPSVLWPGKPSTSDGVLNETLFGVQRNNAGVAYGFVGELYFDSGILGIVVGFALLGAGCQRLAQSKRAITSIPAYAPLYFALVPLVVALARGSLGLIAGRALFSAGPVMVLAVLAWSQLRRDRSAAEDSAGRDRHSGAR